MFLTKKLVTAPISKLIFSLLIFSLCSFFSSDSIVAQEASTEKDSVENQLPTSPETGSPEDDFSAGGTRDNHQQKSFCGAENQQISFLLGNKSRETTVSPHPSFWFYFPEDLESKVQMEFVLVELQTNREIYRRAKDLDQKGIVGIQISSEKEPALSPKINYRWQLSISCQESNLVLDGWLNLDPINPDLQQRLAQTPKKEKYQVYWQENLLADALNELAQTRLLDMDNPKLEQAWKEILSDLGWQDLIHSTSRTLSFW